MYCLRVLSIFFALFLSILLFVSYAEAADGYYYRSAPSVVFDGSSMNLVDETIFISTKNQKIVIGDFSTGLKNCGNKDWICVRSALMFNLAINKRWKKIPSNWQFESVKYQSLGSETISILGKRIDVFLICTVGEKGIDFESTQDACFHFSRKNGVIAIYLYGNGFAQKPTSSYYAVNENGFFSKP